MNAIAKRELAVPGAVSILHVEQEVEGKSLSRYTGLWLRKAWRAEAGYDVMGHK